MYLTSILQTNESNSMLLYVLEKECGYQFENIKKELLRNKYQAKLKEDIAYWNKKPVKEFFKTYKIEITEMLKEYPKVDMDGVLMLEGMAKKDMPFQKDLIQAKLLSKILDVNVILLPRFASNLLNNMFNVNLSKGPLAEGLVALVDGDEYIEFKSAIGRKIIRHLNEANYSATIGFISIDFLDRNEKRRILSKHSQLKLSEGFKGYILSLADGKLYIATEKNKELKLELLAGAPERISGSVDLISTLQTYPLESDIVNSPTLK